MRNQPWPALVKLLRSAFFYYCEITDTLKNKQPGLARSALAQATARGKFKSKQTAGPRALDSIRLSSFAKVFTMTRLICNDNVATKVEYLQIHSSRKRPDIKMHSTDGFYFEMHKEVFCHTKFQRLLLASAGCCPNDDVEIFLPGVSRTVLSQVVRFFYSGSFEFEHHES